MSKLISATYHPNIEVAEFVCDDGRHLLRSGGTLPWRINNPGDLTALVVNGEPAPKKARGYIGFAKNKSGLTFLIFPDEDAGRAELKSNLKRLHGQRTIPEAIPIYAPKSQNNTEKYINDLLKTSGIPAWRKIGECSDSQLEKIMNSISEIEGFHAKPETRKETWVVVSTINATNGSQPLPDAEVILQTEGQKITVKSDSAGRFPLVIHPANKAPIHVKIIDPKTKDFVKIGEIQGETGRDFHLLARSKRWKGVSGSEKINSSMPGKKKPAHYVVQPGDNLGKIAKMYHTSVSAVKENNHLSSDKIYPGEMLLMNGDEKEEASRVRTAPASTDSRSVPKSDSQKPVLVNQVPVLKKRPHPVAMPPAQTGIESSDSERSKEGAGKVMALINPLPGRAPWMPIAIAEAKLRYGMEEGPLQKEINYHTEISDGSTSMADRAWCAAFANWCLMKANYPTNNFGFRDRRATLGRAHGFYEMDEAKKIRNPLFVELNKPIYGAISIATSRSGHGHHVGFAYGKEGEGDIILLGGNQDDRIKFSPFNKDATRVLKMVDMHGRTTEKVIKKPDYLRYFVPLAYYEQAKKDLENPGLEIMDVDALNKVIGVPPRAKKNSKTKID